MIRIDDSVVTAQVLQDRLGSERAVELCPRAKLTPSALDLLRERDIEIVRREAGSTGNTGVGSSIAPASGERRDFKRYLLS